jgi:hypothetical protein
LIRNKLLAIKSMKKSLSLLSIICFAGISGALAQQPVLFRHHTYVDFIKGKVSDSGGNLYISKGGKIQFVNLYDFNADGYPEVVTNNDHNGYDTPDAFIYRNNKIGGLRSLTFPFAQDAPAYQSLEYMTESMKSITRLPAAGGGKAVVADINKDGYKDLVFANFIHGSTLLEMPSYIYWGGADGFNPIRRSVLPADRSMGIAVGDVTGDGLPDIVTANVGREHTYGETPDYSYQTLGKRAGAREKTSYLFRQSDPGFTANAREPIETQFAVDVKIADLKNDGKKSLLFLELGEPGGLRIIPMESGKMGKPQIIPVLNVRFTPSWTKRLAPELLVKDLNGDGYADIFVPSLGKKCEIFWSNKGVFSAGNKTVIESENTFAADADDLNKDGYADLVVASFYSYDGIDNKYSKDNYNFDTNSYIWWGSKEGFSSSKRTALPTKGAINVKIADLDGKGYPDILFAQHRDNYSEDISSAVYHNTKGSFYKENRTDLQGFGAAYILAEDFTGNGRKDVAIINGISGMARHAGLNDGPGNEGVTPTGVPMYIYKGNPVGKYGQENLIRVPEASQETNIAFADMEDKGHADLVYMRTNGYRVAIRYNIYNYPQEKEITEVEIPFRGNSVNVADFNKDGILDMVVTPVSGGKGAFIKGLGNRQYKVEVFDFNNMAYSAVTGDVNNDGLLDVVSCGYSQISILLGNDKGGFHFNKPIVLNSPDFIPRVCLADFNNDGWLDILSQNLQNFDSKVYDIQSHVLINNKGTFSFSNKRSFHTFGANGGSVAQLYGDGKVQFVNSNYHADESRRAATFILGVDAQGFPTDEGKVRLPSYSAGADLVMDFNADGYQDILVYNHTGATVYDGGLNPTGGMHGVGSVIYWGSKNGVFSLDNTSPVPSFGPHSRIAADAGSVGRRNSFETYTSDYLTNTTAGSKLKLTIEGRYNSKQMTIPEILVGKAGATGTVVQPVLISTSPTKVVYEVDINKGQTFRYRLKLESSNTGAGPIVSAVQMEEMR